MSLLPQKPISSLKPTDRVWVREVLGLWLLLGTLLGEELGDWTFV